MTEPRIAPTAAPGACPVAAPSPPPISIPRKGSQANAGAENAPATAVARAPINRVFFVISISSFGRQMGGEPRCNASWAWVVDTIIGANWAGALAPVTAGRLLAGDRMRRVRCGRQDHRESPIAAGTP